MIGLVLAAGAGRRLRPYTNTLPKALMPVHGDLTVLDLTLRNFAQVDFTEAAIVVGYAAEAIRDRKGRLESTYGLTLHLIDNDRAEEWNNAYSLWCARDFLTEGALLTNGDTVHPVSVQKTLLAARGPDIMLALDTVKILAEEEMKVVLSTQQSLIRITKLMDPAEASGEYIGVAVIEASAATNLTTCLEAVWRRDPQLYYEDAFQEMVDRGHRIDGQAIGAVEWVEVDSHADLHRARELACRY